MTMRNKQKGVVLIVSMIMLLLLTLLAVSSMNTTIMEEKITSNYKDKNTAFQSAEAALRDGERYLRNTTPLPIFTGANGLYQPTNSGAPRWNLVVWTDAAQRKSYVGLTGVADQPNYIIEELFPIINTKGSAQVGVELENQFYRVTSQAVGSSETALVMLQSVYKR